MKISKIRWRSAQESNKESDDLTEEVLLFIWGEGVTKTLWWKLDEVWSSFSNEGIYFSIEDVSFLNKESSLEVSESNEKHDSGSKNVIIFEVSSWSKVSDEDSESRFSIFSVDEKDDSSNLVSLTCLNNEN